MTEVKVYGFFLALQKKTYLAPTEHMTTCQFQNILRTDF